MGVPRAHLAGLGLVSTVHVGYQGGRVLRRVNGVSLLGTADRSPDELGVWGIASWDAEEDSFSVLAEPAQVTALARRLAMEGKALKAELDRRRRLLESLVRDGLADQEQIERAVAEFRRSA